MHSRVVSGEMHGDVKPLAQRSAETVLEMG